MNRIQVFTADGKWLKDFYVRPETPAYPAISTAFAEAVNNIVAGADVKKELDKAAKKIDQIIEDNNGYPVK